MDQKAVQLLEKEAGKVLQMGAKATLQSVYECTALPDVLRRTLEGSFSWQRRNEINIERAANLPVLAPKWAAGLLAADATVLLEDGESIDFSAYLQLAEHREIERVDILIDAPGQSWGDAQVGRTGTDDPIVFAVAMVVVKDSIVQQARTALNGVWRQPAALVASVDALVGGPLTAERIREAASHVESDVDPTADFLGSVEYRKAMAAVLTEDALEMCRNGVRS